MDSPTAVILGLYVIIPVFVIATVALVVRRETLRRGVPDLTRRRRALARKKKLVMWWMGWVGGIPALALVGYGLYSLATPAKPPDVFIRHLVGLALSLLGFLVGACLLAWDRWWRRRFLERLEREDHLICPDCHHALLAHARGGLCPACRYGFTRASLLADWSDVKKLLPKAGRSPARKEARERAQRVNPWSQYAVLILLVFVFAVSGLAYAGRIGSLEALLILLALVVFELSAFVYGLMRRQRFLQRLADEDYLICPDCHQSLAGQPGGGKCAKCGYAFTPESLRRDWAEVEGVSTFLGTEE